MSKAVDTSQYADLPDIIVLYANGAVAVPAIVADELGLQAGQMIRVAQYADCCAHAWTATMAKMKLESLARRKETKA